ncbi:MAG: phosphotransferase [Cyclobacteriaceae bacterium]
MNIAIDNHTPDQIAYCTVGEIELTVLNAILSRYYRDLGINLVEVKGIRGTGLTSKNFRCGNYFVKLIYDVDDVMKTCVNYFLTVSDCLNKNQIPVSKFIINDFGDHITNHENQILYVQEFSSEQFYSGTLDELKQVLDILPKLHAALSRLEPLPTHKVVYKDWNPGIIIHSIREKIPAIDKLAEYDQKAIQAIEKIDWVIDWWESNHKYLQESGIHHYDLHPHNLLFGDGELKAIIDLEGFIPFPEKVSTSFSIFKIAKKTLTKNIALLQDVRDFVTEKGFDIQTVNSFARLEIIRRVLIILSAHYLDGNHNYDFDLDKQIRSFSEVGYIFS